MSAKSEILDDFGITFWHHFAICLQLWLQKGSLETSTKKDAKKGKRVIPTSPENGPCGSRVAPLKKQLADQQTATSRPATTHWQNG